MSMKRSIEYSVSSSVSLFSRVLLIGGVLGLATACAHRKAGGTDSTAVAANTTAVTNTAVATPAPAPAVESVSTGETMPSSEAKATPAAAAPAAPPPAAPAAAPAKSPAPVHHVAKKPVDSATKTTTVAEATPAASATPTPAAPAGSTATKSDTGATDDHLLVTPQVYEGWKMFAVYCYRCHGVDAMGGTFAPNLRHSVSSEGNVTHDIFVTTVTYGRTALGMPTWRGLLSPEQIEDLWLYVNARSSGKLAPGRPHKAADSTQ
jgi:mono/diheme cytochrome c family protein